VTFLEGLAYALSKGFWSAYFDVLKERSTAVEEKPNAEDQQRGENFRTAVADLPVGGVHPEAGGPSGPINPPPSVEVRGSVGMGPKGGWSVGGAKGPFG
jgi:hypothetical protein